MKSKSSLILVATVVLAGALLALVLARHPVPVSETVVVPVATPVAVTIAPLTNDSPVAIVDEPVVLPVALVATNVSPQKLAAKKNKSAKVKTEKAPIQDPAAREALSLVGLDPEAEAYWSAAINDPSLPAEERQDLIEDLNEDGLSDPKHPAPEDMPLIVNRLQLIEEMAPSAMDQVNADAFQEAHKDLLNLLNGVPVK